MEDCYCGCKCPFDSCCKPYLEGQAQASSAEALMRSRYSAYATDNFDYIWHTYSKKRRQHLTVAELADGASMTTWLRLEVESANSHIDSTQVSFTAFYRCGNHFYKMHEISSFVTEEGLWRYDSGEMLPDSGEIKLNRNDKCLCGSKKKFKKCCGVK